MKNQIAGSAEKVADMVKAVQIETGKPTCPMIVFENGRRVQRQVDFDGYMFKVNAAYLQPKEVDALVFEVPQWRA